MTTLADDLRDAAVGSVLIVDLEEDFFWSSSIPDDPVAVARQYAEEARAQLAAQGIDVEVEGAGAYIDTAGLIYAGTAHYHYVVTLVGLRPDDFPGPTVGWGQLALAYLPAAVLTGTLALAWPVGTRVANTEWADIRSAAETAVDTVAAGARAVTGITANLALIALLGAAVYFLPRPRA